ncbi:MAG TPA: ATP-binding protein [Candidatus Limnocylindrales bacterium]|nr:ATP-binding protein [Candidatus Limnocylindrales bacterium]
MDLNCAVVLVAAIDAGKADSSPPQFCDKLAKINVLIIDDLGLSPLGIGQGYDFLDIVVDRLKGGSTIMASQLSVEHWYQLLRDPSMAVAVLDRLVHNARQLALSGETMRKV